MKKTFEEVKNDYEKLRETTRNLTNEVNALTAHFASLISYLQRKLPANNFEYAKKWIYEIMETCDYEWRQYLEATSEAIRIYGGEIINIETIIRDECKYDNIKAIVADYHRAVASYGEVKCSIMPETKRRIFENDEIGLNLDLLREAYGDKTAPNDIKGSDEE